MNQNTLEARAEMLIRKPVAEVFEAFINPEITTYHGHAETYSRADEETGGSSTWER